MLARGEVGESLEQRRSLARVFVAQLFDRSELPQTGESGGGSQAEGPQTEGWSSSDLNPRTAAGMLTVPSRRSMCPRRPSRHSSASPRLKRSKANFEPKSVAATTKDRGDAARRAADQRPGSISLCAKLSYDDVWGWVNMTFYCKRGQAIQERRVGVKARSES